MVSEKNIQLKIFQHILIFFILETKQVLKKSIRYYHQKNLQVYLIVHLVLKYMQIIMKENVIDLTDVKEFILFGLIIRVNHILCII